MVLRRAGAVLLAVVVVATSAGCVAVESRPKTATVGPKTAIGGLGGAAAGGLIGAAAGKGGITELGEVEQDVFARADRDKNGKLSLAEFTAARFKDFDAADTNDDEVLSAAEIEATAKK